jgi:hypothetical protein
MVDTISIFFVTMSVVVLGYMIIRVKSKNRLPLLVEIFYLLSYLFVMIVFLFPQLLESTERILGIPSAINFFVYLSIFVGYLMIFILYQKTERQREQISHLTREIALKENIELKNQKDIDSKRMNPIKLLQKGRR